MRIKTRLRINTAIILGLLLVMTAALIWSARTTTVADTDVALAGKMQKSASDRVLVRDDYLLRQSERARIQWEAETETFRGLLAQAKDQLPAADKPILDGIESDFAATVSIFHQIVEIKETQVSAGVDGLPSAEGEQRLVSQLLLQAYSLNNRVLELRDATQAAADANRTQQTWLRFSILLVAAIAIMISSMLIQRLLTRRIERLQEGMDLIGAGRLDHRIPVAGNDELSDLAQAGNAMAARLTETTTSVENLQREVAERKRAEERLQETLEELDTTLHSIGDAVISTDLEGCVRQMNPIAEQLTGWVEAEAQGRPLEEVFHIVQGETRTAVENPVQRVLREGRTVGLANHTLLIDRAGVEHPIADSGSPICSEDNATVGVVLVFRDQTRERAAEKELHELMERQQAILAAVPDIIMEMDRDKVYTWSNQAGREFFGDDVLGHEAVDYFEGEEDVYGVVQPLFNGSSPAVYVESWQRRKDGQVRLLAWWCRQLTDERGNVTGALSSAQDITERKRAEEELQTSQRRLEMALVGGALGTYEQDLQTGEIQVDARYLAMLGYAPGELDLANMKQWEQLVHPEDLAQTRSPHTEVEYRMRHKDGGWIWVLDTGRVVEHDSLGHPLHMSGVHQDITERKRAEEALMEERNLFVAGPTVVFRWQPGLPWRVEYASPNVQELLGYPSEAFTSGSFSYADIVHPDDIDRLLQERTNYNRQSRTHFEQEYRLQRSDGQILWVHDFTRTVIVDGSRQDHGYVTDITEYKRAEERLRESETQYRKLIETMQDGVYRSSHEGKFLEVNPAMVKILGYDSKEELLAIDIKSQLYFVPQDRESAALDEKLSEMGVFRLRKKDGSEIWVEDHGRHVVDDEGTVLYHEGVLRDITERKRAEEALYESEERFRTLVENAPEPILIQTEGRFAYLNRAALREFGAESADQLIGTPVLDRLHPDSHAIVRERIQQLNQGSEKVPLLEEVYLRMDGTPFAVEVSAVPFSYQGRPGALVFLHSIEERKQLERETAKARTDFLYAVSHELKTPLFLMTTMMELIQSRPAEERQRQFLAQEETWIRNLARLRLLINNLVDSQRTPDLGTQIHRVPTNLAAMVRQATQDLDVFAVKQSLTWQLELESLPDLPLDPESIERMLHNLLTNAIKFSLFGGTVLVRLRAVPDRAVLEIEDHGKGISAESLSDLFQPFARSSSAIKAVIPGTGLGLYVSKILVEAHGGTIALASEEGVGTTVTVTLPLKE